MDYMFVNSMVERIDLLNLNLSNVKTMKGFCSNSRVKYLYLKLNQKEKPNLEKAFENTNIQDSNIDEILKKI